jgi:hypothetical protein
VKGDFIFWFSHVTFPCTAMASILESWIMWRLRTRGYTRRWWGVKLYWRVAPKLGWSRLPVILSNGIVTCGFAALLF